MNRFFPRRILLTLIMVLAGGLLFLHIDTRFRPAPTKTPLVEIKNIETLRSQFNRDAGKTRLILLVSPT